MDITWHKNLAEAWLDRVVVGYGILPMDAAAFREWARLKHRKSDTLIEDAMIAATAIVHDLIVVTRNTRDFEHFGVSLLRREEELIVAVVVALSKRTFEWR